MNAQGSPKIVDDNGNEKDSDIQKHGITFGSDIDVNVPGAKFELQGAEFNVGTVKTMFTSSDFQIQGKGNVILGSAETIIAADNSITLSTTSLLENINFPPSPIPKAKSGILRNVGGSCETIMTPGASSDAIPRYTVANPSGPVTVTSGATGYANTVLTGGMLFNNAVGPIDMTAATGRITATCPAGPITIACIASPLTLKGLSIFLN